MKSNINRKLTILLATLYLYALVSCSHFQSIPNTNKIIQTQTYNPDTQSINPKTAHSIVKDKQISLNSVTGFTWLPDGQGVVFTNDDELSFFQMTSGKSYNPTAQIQTDTPIMVRVSFSTKKLAWTNSANFLHLWDIEKQVEMPAIGNGSTPITGLAFSQVEPKIAIASYDKSISIWDVELQKQLNTWATPSWLSELSFSPDNRIIAGVDFEGFSLFMYKIDTGEEVREIKWSDSATAVLYNALLSPDWSKVAWVSRGIVQIVDTSDYAVGPLLAHEDYISDVAWAPNSQVLATAAGATVDGQFSPVVLLWDVQTGRLLNTLIQQAGVIEINFSPDGHELAILLSSGVLQIWAIE